MSHRYCSVSDWIQFEETEGSEEKRLNWFEAQAKEKSEKDGERNGEDLTPYEAFKFTFLENFFTSLFFVAGKRALRLRWALPPRRTNVLYVTRNWMSFSMKKAKNGI
jgi:hypothetical protein